MSEVKSSKKSGMRKSKSSLPSSKISYETTSIEDLVNDILCQLLLGKKRNEDESWSGIDYRYEGDSCSNPIVKEDETLKLADIVDNMSNYISSSINDLQSLLSLQNNIDSLDLDELNRHEHIVKECFELLETPYTTSCKLTDKDISYLDDILYENIEEWFGDLWKYCPVIWNCIHSDDKSNFEDQVRQFAIAKIIPASQNKV